MLSRKIFCCLINMRFHFYGGSIKPTHQNSNCVGKFLMKCLRVCNVVLIARGSAQHISPTFPKHPPLFSRCVAGLTLTMVVRCLHLSVPAKMFSGRLVPGVWRCGHWSMSTRRKSMSMPDVPLREGKAGSQQKALKVYVINLSA